LISPLILGGLLVLVAACTAKPAREVSALPAAEPRAQARAALPARLPQSVQVARERTRPSEVAGLDDLYPAEGESVDRLGANRRRATGAVGDITLNFADADLREVVKVVLGNMLNLNFVIDPNVAGKVTLKTERPLRRAALIPTLEAVLATQGARLIAQGDVYRVARTSEPAELAAGGIGVGRAPLADGAGLQVFPLDFISAGEMEKILKPLLPAGAIVHADGRRNVLVVAGSGPQLKLAAETVGIFDVDQMAGQNVLLISVKNVDPRAVVGELTSIFGADAASSGPGGLVQLIPVERLNAVLVISKQMAYVDKARAWIQRLDTDQNPNERRVFVYYVQHSRAGKLVEALRDITGWVGADAAGGAAAAAGAAAPPPSPEAPRAGEAPRIQPTRVDYRAPGANSNLGTGLRVAVDEERNALLVSATPKDFTLIEDVLAKLDIQPLQVMIEASIFEVTLRDELRYGIQYAISNGGLGITSDGLISLARGTTTATTTAGLVQPIISSQLPGFGFTLEGDSRARFIIDALSALTEVNVISSPNVIVLNNQSAQLRVGDEVPIITQTTTSTLTTNPLIVNTVQYRSTGVTLDVTPRVNASGMITVEIAQEVSDVAVTTTSRIDSPTIQNRSILSTVSVKNGETVMLGGLIRENASRSDQGIPILNEIPVIGALFGQKAKTANRTELVVLIRPLIAADPEQTRSIGDDLRRKFQTLLQREQTGIPQPRQIIETQ
jgi:general secretion pathway protein D